MIEPFILVISLWGNDGEIDHYIGQVSLQHEFSQKQCHWMLDPKRWAARYDNSHYKLAMHCFPARCANQEKCE